MLKCFKYAGVADAVLLQQGYTVQGYSVAIVNVKGPMILFFFWFTLLQMYILNMVKV